jgi:hypothetical protein
MIDALDKLAPENAHYRHNAEGSDDMVPPLPLFGEVDCSLRISRPCWPGRVSRFRFREGSWRWGRGRGYIFVNLGRLRIGVLLLLLSRENETTVIISFDVNFLFVWGLRQ